MAFLNRISGFAVQPTHFATVQWWSITAGDNLQAVAPQNYACRLRLWWKWSNSISIMWSRGLNGWFSGNVEFDVFAWLFSTIFSWCCVIYLAGNLPQIEKSNVDLFKCVYYCSGRSCFNNSGARHSFSEYLINMKIGPSYFNCLNIFVLTNATAANWAGNESWQGR